MRDVTKALTSYTWAMSVFWTQQMFNLMGLGGSGSWQRSTRALDNVIDATAGEMGDTMRAVFRGGDTLQRGLVDVFLAPFSFGSWCDKSGAAPDRRQRDGDYRRDQYAWRDDREGGWGPMHDRRSTADDGHRRYPGMDADRRRSDGPRRSAWTDAPPSERSPEGARAGWVDTAARVAAAGVNAMQVAAETTDRVTRRGAETAPAQARPTAPPASDPSLGWGPMPR
jgi:hypothetical protein